MKEIILALLFYYSSISYGEVGDYCLGIDAIGKVEAERISSAESGHTVSTKGLSYFYSAPDNKCKTNKFIIFKDQVDAYMEYNSFYYIMYFGKNGVTTEGWVKSERLKKMVMVWVMIEAGYVVNKAPSKLFKLYVLSMSLTEHRSVLMKSWISRIMNRQPLPRKVIDITSWFYNIFNI